MVILFAWLFGVLILVRNFPDHEIGNRIQHALGGGFAIVLIVYYSCIASNVPIQRRQFFFLAFFLASCFGIFNELLESIMQIGWGMFFADSIEDTWYDLWSNSA